MNHTLAEIVLEAIEEWRLSKKLPNGEIFDPLDVEVRDVISPKESVSDA